MEHKRLIYSPEKNIPIGEPVVLPGGGHGIRFRRKRRSGEVMETVSLDKLFELAIDPGEGEKKG